MKSIKTIGMLLIAFFTSTSFAQSPEIYSPFIFSNPDRLDLSGGYCKNSTDEKKLWTEINKFSKSFLLVVPKIPPQQKSYIQAEFNSNNNERSMRITMNSFYKMNDIYEEISNIEQLSSTYLKHQNKLALAKKMEIIGRTLANLNNENIPYNDIRQVAADLRAKDYFITPENLMSHWAIKSGLKRSLIFHLICYGEKLN